MALCDPLAANAERFAARYGVRNVYRSHREMLDSVPLDVVHILTPPEFHYAQALDVIESGVHVLLEKPCTINPEELEDLYRVGEAKRVRLCPDFIQLFHPSFLRGAALIESGELGNVVHVQVHLSLDLMPLELREAMGLAWRYKLPGGILHDNMTHLVYLALRWLGKPKQIGVSAQCHNTLPQGLTDHLNIILEGEHCTANLTMSGVIKPESYYIQVFCERGSVLMNFDTSSVVTNRNGILPRAFRRATSNFHYSYQLIASGLANAIQFVRGKLLPYQGLENLIPRFYHCIRNGGELPVSKELAISVAETEATIFKEAGKLHLDTRTRPSKQTSITRSDKILVTGATGYLGSKVARRLVKEGYYVRALVRELSHAELLENLGVEILYGDIRNREALVAAAKDMDIIVHMAAALRGSSEFMLDCAIKGTQNVAHAAKTYDLKRVIYISSMSVYDALKVQEGELLTEDSPLEEFPQLRGTYSLAKRQAEDIALSYLHEASPAWTILRPSVIVGAGHNIFSPLGAKLGNFLLCPGSRNKLVRLIHVDDVAAAVAYSVQNPGTRGRIFNLSDKGVTQQQYIDEVVRQSEYRNIRLVYIPYWVATLAAAILNSARLLSSRIPSINRRRVASVYQSVKTNTDAMTAATGWHPRKNILKSLVGEATELENMTNANSAMEMSKVRTSINMAT